MLLPVVSSRGAAARVAGAAGTLPRGGFAAMPAGRGTGGPSRSAHGADCLREPQAPSLRASPGERRSPELAAQGAANVQVRRECLALSVHQDQAGQPAETSAGWSLSEHRRVVSDKEKLSCLSPR